MRGRASPSMLRATSKENPTVTEILRSRPAAIILTGGIIALTLATANIHRGLGGLLFTLNAAGYVTLAIAYLIGAWATHPFIRRFSWLPRVALFGFTAMTFVAYFVIGPYFTLGYVAKAIEAGILVLIGLDVVRVYGGPAGLVRAAMASVPMIASGDRSPAD